MALGWRSAGARLALGWRSAYARLALCWPPPFASSWLAGDLAGAQVLPPPFLPHLLKQQSTPVGFHVMYACAERMGAPRAWVRPY